LIRLLKAGGESDNSEAAAFAEPSLAIRTKASSERNGGNLRMVKSPNWCIATFGALAINQIRALHSIESLLGEIARNAIGIVFFALAQ
jgi:hypothetical protein